MKNPWSATRLAPVLCVVGLVLAGCPPGTPTGGASRSLSGIVRDVVTGAALPAMTVEFSTLSTTTGADGRFSIDLGGSGGAMNGAFCLRGAGYSAYYVAPVSLDTGTDTEVSLWTSSTSAYPTCAVTVKILASSLAEIAAGTNVDLFILNRGGGYTGKTGVAYVTGGCSIASPTFGNDCLVAATVYSATPFNVMATQKNLSTAATVTLTQDTAPADTIPVSVTGDLAGCYGQLQLSSPYGVFGAGAVELAGDPATATLNVTNPEGYSAVWSQVCQTTLGGASKMLMAVSGAAALSSTVTLPAVSLTIGATELPEPASLAYAPDSGTLSIAPVGGVNYHQFYLYNMTDSVPVGAVISTSPSVVLPGWLQADLAAHEVYVALTPVGVDVLLDVSVVGAITAAHNGPPSVPMRVGVLTGTYAKTVTF